MVSMIQKTLLHALLKKRKYSKCLMKRANEQKQRDKRKNEYDNNKIHAIINMGFGVIQTKENR